MRDAKAPSLFSRCSVPPRTPRAVKRLTTTVVWYRMFLSISARPWKPPRGRMWPLKNGPMMRPTDTVAPRYLSTKSDTTPKPHADRSTCSIWCRRASKDAEMPSRSTAIPW